MGVNIDSCIIPGTQLTCYRRHACGICELGLSLGRPPVTTGYPYSMLASSAGNSLIGREGLRTRRQKREGPPFFIFSRPQAPHSRGPAAKEMRRLLSEATENQCSKETVTVRRTGHQSQDSQFHAKGTPDGPGNSNVF